MSVANANTPLPSCIDLLVEPEWIIPVEPAGVVLTSHALAVDKGKIVDIGPAAQLRARYAPTTVTRLPGQVLMPGLVNLHCHAAMSLLRGFADDLPLQQWLQTRIWPAEAQFAGPDFVRTGSLLACMEMLRGGITCFNDMYFFAEETAVAVLETGLRAALGLVVIDFPTPYAAVADDYLHKGIALRDRYRDESRLSFCLAPHAPYTVGDATFERVTTLAAQIDLPIHLHAHETRAEIDQDTARYGMRPLARLAELGVLGPQTILAHGVHLNDQELVLLARHGAHIAHCPTSNLKLASGMARADRWLEQGINFGLGTDGAASNNRLDLWQEMRLAALLAKGQSGDAAVLAAHAALHAATLAGARALGLAERIGSLLPGKCADMIAVSLDDWPLQPCYDPASHLVNVCGREQVSHVWVQGKCRMREGQVCFSGMPELIERMRIWHTRIQATL